MPTPSPSTATEPPLPQRPGTSVRSDIGPISNALLYLAFCVLAATGLVMTFRLEDGRAMLLGLSKQDFARLHAITALSVLSLVLLHLWVNWRWIRAMLARLRWRTLVVGGVGLAMLAAALIAPVH
jgi:magnesium-transporting ATPase (P-type)